MEECLHGHVQLELQDVQKEEKPRAVLRPVRCLVSGQQDCSFSHTASGLHLRFAENLMHSTCCSKGVSGCEMRALLRCVAVPLPSVAWWDAGVCSYLAVSSCSAKGYNFFFSLFFWGGVGCREAEKSLWLANAYCFLVSTCVWIICVHLCVWLPAPNALLIQQLLLPSVTWSSLISYDCKCSRGTLLGSFKVAK